MFVRKSTYRDALAAGEALAALAESSSQLALYWQDRAEAAEAQLARGTVRVRGPGGRWAKVAA